MEVDLRRVVDALPGMVWTALADGQIDFVNQRWCEYTGLSVEEAWGRGWHAAIHSQDLAELLERWQSILASGQPRDAEARVRRCDGEYQWFLFRACPLAASSENLVRWCGIWTDIDDRRRVEELRSWACFTGYLRDITERKRSEEQLRHSEAFFAQGEQLSSTGSFSWRVTTDEIRWSAQTYRIFELDEDVPLTLELIDRRVHPDDRPLWWEHVRRARGDGGDLEFELRLQMPDDSIKYLHLIAHDTRAEDGQPEYIGAVQDVTERRRAQDTLGKVRSELAYVARITSLGALTASIAHELSQPLSAIMTNASACLRWLAADPPNVDAAIDTARRSIRDGQRASEVIVRLRALFGKHAATPESVDLTEATREVIALTSNELQRARVILRTELAEGMPLVSGDRVQLQQVILNLLLNASEAMKDVDDRPRELLIRTARDEGDRVCLTVQDAGVGFDVADLDRLIDAFYTTKSNGMGIGLSVSRTIVERHRGRLWAARNQGPGATFAFSIPCGSAEQP